ncbi:MAG: hypothetical protein JRH17_05055 [Deltaproteobacteria bacterium]|nr:hypothetical protein [Deltaproteobacteria bacterium]
MAESREDRIQRLLSEGLDLYGLGEVSAAIVTWEKVLELDPSSSEALDYIRTADRRQHPRPPRKANMAGAVAAVLQEAQALLRQEDFGAALDVLRSASGPGFGGIEFEATLDLTRSRLYACYTEQVGDLSRIPHVESSPGSLKQFNLPSDAGFMLSMVDGTTSVADLISVSGMDAFEALHTLSSLMEAGIVEMRD